MMKYETIVFKWYERKQFTFYTAKDCTLEDALQRAISFGYTESKWYKPWTWNNSYTLYVTKYPDVA